MSKVTPPPSTTGPGGPIPQANISGVVNAPPRTLADATPGTLIEGEVIGKSNVGETTIKTDQGILNVRLSQNVGKDLAIGTKVTLEVKSSGESLRLQLVHIEAPKTAETAKPVTSQPTPPTVDHPSKPVVQTKVSDTAPATSGLQTTAVTKLEAGVQVAIQISGKTTVVPPQLSGKQAYQPGTVFQGIASQNKGAVIKGPLPDGITSGAKPVQPAATNPSGTTSPSTPSSVSPTPSAIPGAEDATQQPTFSPLSKLSPGALTTSQQITPSPSAPQQGQGAEQLSGKVYRPTGPSTPPVPLVGKEPGKPIQAKIIAIQEPGAPRTWGQTDLTSQRFAGVVSGINAQNQVLVEAGNIILTLPKTAVPPQTGTLILFDISNSPTATAQDASFTTSSAPTNKAPALPFTQNWPVLDDILQTISLQAPTAAQTFVQNALPQPGPKLGVQALFWMTAIFGQTTSENVLPQTVRQAIQQSPQGPTLKTLDADLQVLTRAAIQGQRAERNPTPPTLTATPEQPVADWRSLHLPLFHMGQLEQMNAYYRDELSDSGTDNAEKQTRLVIDLNLTNLGQIQVDSVFGAKRYDLTLHLGQPMTNAAQHGLRQVFISYVEAMGYTGQVTFKQTEKPPYSPAEDIIAIGA